MTARKSSALEAIPNNDRVLKLELDVTLTSSIDDALRATLERFGRIDVVVNNAGYALAGDTEGAEDGESRAVFDTNFWGMVDVTKRTLGIFRDVNPKTGQQGGVVVNVSSLGGWSGFPGQSFYHSSKFAMEGWTESVAKELPASWNSKCFCYKILKFFHNILVSEQRRARAVGFTPDAMQVQRMKRRIGFTCVY